jgi:hypothetical protein
MVDDSRLTEFKFPSNDLGRDVRARHTSQNYYGYDRWFAGHRNGETGVNNPNTSDIQSMFPCFLSNLTVSFKG